MPTSLLLSFFSAAVRPQVSSQADARLCSLFAGSPGLAGAFKVKMDPRKNERPERHDEGPDKVSETQTDGKVVGGRSRSNSDGTPAAAPAVTSSPHSDPRASPVSMKEGDSSDIPSSSEQDKKMDKTHAPEAASPSAVQQYNNNSTSTGTSNKKVNQHLYHAPARDVEATTIRDHNPNDTGSALGAPATGGEGDTSINSVEKDAAHFKMVAARFRALMERRERRLEEAMSDPQTRTDLEGMFPGVREGDYQTLLAGVRGMEEEDFQALLAAARKRRREVRCRSFPGPQDNLFCVVFTPSKLSALGTLFYNLWS